MLLFIDGFDHMSGGTGLATKYASTSSATTSGTAARTGTAGLSFSTNGANVVSKPLPASGGFAVGFAVKTSTAWGNNNLLEIREGSTVHLVVATDNANHLQVKIGASIHQVGTRVLGLNAWYYVEFKGIIDDAAGSYTLRIDEVNELTASGIDTRNAGATGQWDRFMLGAAGSNYFYDDLYVCDLSGATNNDFRGVCKVETLLPQTDAVSAGSNAGLTPSGGTDHGALVDENPPNTTDYNSSPTVGVKDTYQFPSLVLTGNIFGLQTNLYVAKADAAARQVCAVVRSGGTDYDGGNVAPATTFGYFSEVRPVNPATGSAWTAAEVAGIEVGMKVTA